MRNFASLILIVCAAFGAIACQSAQANNTAQRRAIALTADQAKVIDEIKATAKTLTEENKKARETFAAKLTDDQKKLIAEYDGIATKEAQQAQGLQNLITQTANRITLDFVKKGQILGPDVDKFQLYNKPDGGYELADAAAPAPSPTPAANPQPQGAPVPQPKQ